MLSAALNFTNLSVEGYASFILALIFTIITIASAIYVARHKNLSTILIVVVSLVVPMVTVFCWIYLLLTVLAQPLVSTLCISFACALGYGLIALFIGFVVNKTRKNTEENLTSENTEETKNEEEASEAEESTVFTPYLIAEESEKQEEIKDKE